MYPMVRCLSLLRSTVIVIVLCAAAAIVSPAQTLTTLINFNQTNGSIPAGPLLQGADGNFYGTTSGDGANGKGTFFKFTPGSPIATLYSFCSLESCTDGSSPSGPLVQGSDGNFYGTTEAGGNRFDGGTVFKITPSGTLTTLYTFCSQAKCADGKQPLGLVQSTTGILYGVTGLGGKDCFKYEGFEVCGTGGWGTVFRITTAGSFGSLYEFCSLRSCADGGQPLGTLTLGSDANFYGTTSTFGPGDNLAGTVFKITPGGRLIPLTGFCTQANCADGRTPNGVVQGVDGNFYGTTLKGGTTTSGCGTNGCGVAFKMTPSGTRTTLYTFCSQANCTDGAYPNRTTLVPASDGNYYGTTAQGGTGNCPMMGTVGGCGILFQLTPTGSVNILHNFDNSDGNLRMGASLMQAVDGTFYGTTTIGGSANLGTLFNFSMGFVVSPVQFVPVTPCRLVDTRQTGTPIQGGTWQSFTVPQLGSCNIPATAAAYSLNVTVVPRGVLSYVTIWPAGKTLPLVSTMNSFDGRVKANAAIVPAGSAGAVSVFASDTTDLVLDINGYFTGPGSQTLAFYPLAPCRVIDTRNDNGDLGGPSLGGGQTRNFPVTESSCLQGISNAQAYSFNFTAVPTRQNPNQPLGYLTVWPQGGSQPTVSTLNNPTATVVANAAIVPAGTAGGISVFASNNTDFLVDINGYFAAPGTGGLSFYPVAPCRVLDTRYVGSGNPISGLYPVSVATSVCAPPSSAQAYVLNATVVPPGALGYLTLWPDGQNQPTVSTLNALDGLVTSNMAIVPTTNGSIDAYASNLTQLVLDISSYFAP